MRYIFLILAAALIAETTKARADMVYYNITGTIRDIVNESSSPTPSLSFASGDRITWTLQYDRSVSASISGHGWNQYYLNGPTITNIVDQTTGYHFPTFSPSIMQSAISVDNPTFISETWGGARFRSAEYTLLQLGTAAGSLPSSNLADLQLNNIPVNPFSGGYPSFLKYYIPNGNNVGFEASMNSISAPMHGAPEPGSLTLFLLGAAGLAVRAMRRRLGRVGS